MVNSDDNGSNETYSSEAHSGEDRQLCDLLSDDDIEGVGQSETYTGINTEQQNSYTCNFVISQTDCNGTENWDETNEFFCHTKKGAAESIHNHDYGK